MARASPGSGVAIGIQSKGTAVIHRADLEPLDNLELFGMSPLYTLESYRAMGRNAAGYALGKRVGPVPTQLDNFARAKLIVRTTPLHARETQAIVPGAEPVELAIAVPVGPVYPSYVRSHPNSSHGAVLGDGHILRSRTAPVASFAGAPPVAWIVTVQRMRGMDAGPGTDLGHSAGTSESG